MAVTQAEVTLVEGHELSLDDLLALYDAVGWTAYTQHPERLAAAVAGSHFVVSAWLDGRLVGLLRTVSDDASIAFVQDVLVHPEVQRTGVGARLMRAFLDRYAHVRQKALLTDGREAQRRLYEATGFSNTRLLRRTPLEAWVRYEGVDLE